MVVGEMVTRAGFTENQKEKLMNLRYNGDSVKRDKDILVKTLWSHYKESGFLSSRILRYLDNENSGHTEQAVIEKMVESLPKKAFKIMPVHD